MQTYNFLCNNCNHLTHEILKFLTENPLPDYVLKQNELLNDTPFGQMILENFRQFPKSKFCATGF